ncbi:Hypothetical predicted protein [Olea europaea subsp. europaea]|nr:Hypothetical predicted protein [Olea europaea subsp. europaea]
MTFGTWRWRDGTRSSWRLSLLLPLLISHFALVDYIKGLTINFMISKQ